MSMPKPWEGKLENGTDIGKFCLQTWAMLEKALSTEKLPVEFINNRIIRRWTTYTFTSPRLNPMKLSSLIYTTIVTDVAEIKLGGKDVIRLMFAISPITSDIALHPIQAQYNIVTGLWDFRVDVSYEEVIVEVEVRREVLLKQVSLKDAVSSPNTPDNLPEEPPNSKSVAVCTVEWIAQYITETDKAVLVRGVDKNWERWIPKSQMSDMFQTKANGGYSGAVVPVGGFKSIYPPGNPIPVSQVGYEGKQPQYISFYTPKWLWDKARQELRQEAAMKQRQQAALVGLRQQAERKAQQADRVMFDDSVEFRTDAPPYVIFDEKEITLSLDDFIDKSLRPNLLDLFVESTIERSIDDFPDKPSRTKKEKAPQVTVVKVVGKRKLDI